MGGQEFDIGRRKGEPRAVGTGRYKGEKVKGKKNQRCFLTGVFTRKSVCFLKGHIWPSKKIITCGG